MFDSNNWNHLTVLKQLQYLSAYKLVLTHLKMKLTEKLFMKTNDKLNCEYFITTPETIWLCAPPTKKKTPPRKKKEKRSLARLEYYLQNVPANLIYLIYMHKHLGLWHIYIYIYIYIYIGNLMPNPHYTYISNIYAL